MADVPHHFETPSWLDSGRTGHVPRLPVQAEGTHDDIVVPVPTGPPPGVLQTAHWVERKKPRLVAGTILVLAMLGMPVCLFLAVTRQSVPAVIGLGGCALLTVLFRGAMMSVPLTTVDLRGSRLTVRHGGDADTFDLAASHQATELVGQPGGRDWRLLLETFDGRILELGPHQVDAAALDSTVRYHRSVAEGRVADV